MDGMKRLIFTSFGLNTRTGMRVIKEALKTEMLGDKKILLISVPGYELDEILLKACVALGFNSDNVIFSSGMKNRNQYFEYVYLTEGNTFEIVDYMRREDLFWLAKKCVQEGATFIGASAGAAIAGTDFELMNDFDSNYSRISDYTGLQLYEGIVIPHCEPEELERYLANTSQYRLGRYKKVYSVGNNGYLIL